MMLLLIGVVIFIAVYLYSRLKKDLDQQFPGAVSTDVSNSYDDEQGVIVDSSVYSCGDELVDTKNNLYDEQDGKDALDDELIELGYHIKIGESKEAQDDFFQADPVNTEVTSAVSNEESRLEGHKDSGLVEKVMVIYLLAQPDTKFTGSELKRVAEVESLQFGEDRYFHRYRNADNRTDSVFGIANILEPGLFDFSNSKSFSTTGLVFFQQLSNAEGALEAFDEMLKTVLQFKEQLDGRLQDSSRHPLNKAAMIELRKQVSAFSLENPVTPF